MRRAPVDELLGLLRSFAVYWRPGRQRGLRSLYAPFVEPGSLVFDVGAHLGDRTVAFASLGARVVALEPQPGVARWLRRIAGRKKGVVVLEEAVGAEVGTASLAVSRRTPTVSTLSSGWRRRMMERNLGFDGVRWEDEVAVPLTTLDALVARFGLPTFCKLDIEGHEAEALAGLTHPIAGISFEFVQGGLDIARACVDHLDALGPYRFNAVAREERRFRFRPWLGAVELRAWLDAGADGLAFGDVYAKIDTGTHEAPFPSEER
ncbi:MAG: FkbM family methyltransferase [Gemmatimonadota bacterium]|nr:FkbM family methyltransferase [Gemmatimonadota bacterium]